MKERPKGKPTAQTPRRWASPHGAFTAHVAMITHLGEEKDDEGRNRSVRLRALLAAEAMRLRLWEALSAR